MSALEAVAAWADVGLFSPWEEIDSCVDSISCIATGVYSVHWSIAVMRKKSEGPICLQQHLPLYRLRLYRPQYFL